jgi:uncharacterized protein YjdB/VanZ family protein
MEQKISTIQRFRWWLLISFICSNAFIAGNALLSSDESSDLSTGISETLINIARAVLPPAEVVITPATSVTLTLRDDASSIYIGTSNRLTATFSPLNTSDKTLTWTSSNPSIMEVTNGGIVIARNFGTATITATSRTENVLGTKTITVVNFPSPTDFDIQAYIGEFVTTVIEKDTSAKIRLENILPTNAIVEDVMFTSSNSNVASINEDGVVIGLTTGEFVVTASLGSLEKTLNLRVEDEVDVIAPTSFTLQSDSTIYVGRPQTIDIDFGATLPTDQQVTFMSSNSRIANVNDEGLITPMNFAGYQDQTVTITAYVNADPTLIDTLTLTIAKVFPTSLQIRVAGVVEAGKTITITPTFGPVDVTDRQLTYSTSDASIATVSSAGDTGVALGQAPGRVTITATSLMDPFITATLELEVVPATLLTPDVISGIYLFVRKGLGHIGLNFINGILGFFTFYAFYGPQKNRYFWMSLTLGFVLGFIFEGLQYLAPGRSPDFVDVIYNVIGYTVAQCLLLLVVVMIQKRNQNKEKISKHS